MLKKKLIEAKVFFLKFFKYAKEAINRAFLKENNSS